LIAIRQTVKSYGEKFEKKITTHRPPTPNGEAESYQKLHSYSTYPNQVPDLAWIGQTLSAELETKAVSSFVQISQIFEN
jgi:hypothetical protein